LDHHLVKEAASTKIKILLCEPEPDLVKLPICIESDDYTNCLNSLQQGEIDAIIANCPFRHKSGPMAIRTKSEGVLIQGSYLSVTEGTRSLLQRPPYVVYTNEILKVNSLAEELSFKNNFVHAIPRIEISKLSGAQIAVIKVKAFWAGWRDALQTADYLSYISLLLEVIFGPLTLVGICLSCQKRRANRRTNLKAMDKKNRKRNYEENIRMLETGRNRRR